MAAFQHRQSLKKWTRMTEKLILDTMAIINPRTETESGIKPATSCSQVLFCMLYHLSYIRSAQINLLPDDKILDWSKMKQIADKMSKCILNEKCHIVWKTL